MNKHKHHFEITQYQGFIYTICQECGAIGHTPFTNVDLGKLVKGMTKRPKLKEDKA